MTPSTTLTKPASGSRLLQPVLPPGLPELPPATSTECPPKDGAVFTKAWAAESLLDLAGYDSSADLGGTLAVEPAAGEGVFLLPMARRLVSSCRRHGRPLAGAALLAFELDAESARRARASLADALAGWGVSPSEAERLADAWVRTGDYLDRAPGLPPAGFVLGNPPYLRPEDVDPARYAAYRRAYPAMVGRAELDACMQRTILGWEKPVMIWKRHGSRRVSI